MALRTRRLAATAAALALAALLPQGALAQQRCVVTDPTGTPLNVRTHPNGQVVGIVPNGRPVRILDTAGDPRGRPWAYVAERETGEPIGWVFREFVSCF